MTASLQIFQCIRALAAIVDYYYLKIAVVRSFLNAVDAPLQKVDFVPRRNDYGHFAGLNQPSLYSEETECGHRDNFSLELSPPQRLVQGLARCVVRIRLRLVAGGRRSFYFPPVIKDLGDVGDAIGLLGEPQ